MLINFNQQFRLGQMNSILLSIILLPILEIYLLIKIGSQIGALFTILLIFITAIIGIYYAKYEGLNTLKSGFVSLSKNEIPTFEIFSGAAIAFAALLLIIPGFLSDIFGFLIIFPITRKFIFNYINTNFSKKKFKKDNFIDGEFEDIEDDNDRKI
tara:strand:- start:121 stop:585 length:465 start_codon:yes stop_codon:yes gene_type:complete